MTAAKKVSSLTVLFCLLPVALHCIKCYVIFIQTQMQNKRVKEMSGRVPEVRHTVVLIGGGEQMTL